MDREVSRTAAEFGPASVHTAPSPISPAPNTPKENPIRTLGISDKVSAPTLLGVGVGLILILTGDTYTGKTVLLAALSYGAVGYVAPAGVVETEIGPASDDLLPEDM